MFSINGFEACKPEYHPNYEHEKEISEEESKEIKLNNLKVLFSNKLFEDKEES